MTMMMMIHLAAEALAVLEASAAQVEPVVSEALEVQRVPFRMSEIALGN
jgi:hypothetical protein